MNDIDIRPRSCWQNNDKDGELGSVQILSTIVEELRIGDVSQGG